MYRIYFDSNDTTEEGLFGLWLDQSKRDLSRIPGGPRDDMTVTIYMTGEIEMEATLVWNARWTSWTARPIEGTVRDNEET